MKKLLLFLFVCINCTCFAQPDQNSVFWKISGNGLNEPSYLFGTLHAVPAKQFVIGDSILKYLNQSETLILEINPDIPVSEQINLAKRMFLPQGNTIREYTDSIEFELFYTYLRDSLSIKEDKLNRYFALKPSFMQTMVMMEFIEKPKVFEKEFKNLAGKKKQFIPLETLDEQMNLLDSIPFEHQLTLHSEHYKIDREYFQLLDIYLSQDLKGMDSIMFSDPDFRKMEYELLTKRNVNWIPKIKGSILNGSTFIAVGCAHLLNENGLISLLRKEGYILEPIYTK